MNVGKKLDYKCSFIINFLESYNLVDSVKLFDKHIHNNNILNNIYDIFNGRSLTTDTNFNILNYYMGIYYHFKINDTIKAKKFYNLLSRDNCVNYISYFHIARLFNKLEQHVDAIEYYKLEIELKKCTKSMHNIANIYKNIGNVDLAIFYYLSSIEDGNQKSMYFLGSLYHERKNYNLAEKYYKMAASPPYFNKYAMYNLGKLYDNMNKKISSEKYYLLSLEAGSNKAYTALERLYRYNTLKLYHRLTNIKFENNMIKGKINELKKSRRIICYENKIKFLYKMGECVICLDTNILIPTECAHYHCKDCIIEINKCTQCNTEII